MRDGISCFFVKKTFPKKAQFGIPLPPWERLETGTFEFLLQAGAIWQSDMGGPNVSILFGPLEFQKRLWRCQHFLANPTPKMVPTEGFSYNFI